MSMKEFPELLRQKRKELGLTLRQVADAAECSISYVSDVERRRRAPFGPEKLARLAPLLQIPLEELIAAARVTSGITLESDQDPLRGEAMLALARRWKAMSPDQLKQIIEIAGPGDSEDP